MVSAVRSGKSARISRHRHAAAEVVQHVTHRDARAFDAGLAAAYARVNRDAILINHAAKVNPRAG